jgi:hypothetical protein
MKKLKSLAIAAALSASASAFAGPITADAGWYGFCFGAAGSGATAGCQNQGVDVTGNTITFTVAAPSLLKVTDAFNSGDVFDVYIDSVLAFTTSAPVMGGVYSENPDAAFSSGYYSAGSFLLNAGSYSVDIIASASPFGAGGAYVEVESASVVPSPDSFWLTGLGLLVLAALRRKKA